jgi:hypothetical protein
VKGKEEEEEEKKVFWAKNKKRRIFSIKKVENHLLGFGS